jgi:plastocyanin
MRRPLTLLGSPLLLGVVLFVFSVGLPPFDDLTTIYLPLHMLQHTLIAVAGVLIGYSLFKRGTFSRLRRTAWPGLGALAVAGLLVFWHLPIAWDAAVLNPGVHAIEHLSFLLIGLLIGSLLLMLSDRLKVGLLVLGMVAQLGYGWALLSNIQVYPLYSLSQQSSLGVAMLLSGPFYSTGVLYLVARNQRWFEESQPSRPITTLGRSPLGRRGLGAVSATLSVVLVATLVLYYAGTIADIASSTRPSTNTPVVYISETPVSWQYSPQSITVVMGENNTVTWVSHSVSYETVTSMNGTPFSSGPIAPGHTFTHTFTQPGVYRYQCTYHPWMVGYVKVIGRSQG